MDMITFEEAREIVRRQVEPMWGPLSGTFYVAEWGAESDQYFKVNVGAREFLVDDDEEFAEYSGVLHLVDKVTGLYLEGSYLDFDQLESFVPIGDVPMRSERDKETETAEPYEGIITFEEAVALVTAERLKTWESSAGTFYVANYGWENEEFFRLVVGTRELLVEGNEDWRSDSASLDLVEKKTGQYIRANYHANLDWMKTLTPIGANPFHGIEPFATAKRDNSEIIAELILNYSSKFIEALPDGHGVSSPLGAWLLLALLAPYSEGSNRKELELVLGIEAEEASLAASNFISHLGSDLKGAVGLWYRDVLLDAVKLESFLKTLNPIVTRHDTMSQEILDNWVQNSTSGIIKEFPLEVNDDTAIVVASALATKIRWRRSFEYTTTFEKGAFSGKEGMEAKEEHHMAIYKTSYGLVGVHMAESLGGKLEVYSLIAENPNWSQKTTEKAAMEVISGEASAVSLFDLPLGESHQWSVSENSRGGELEIVDAVVAPWEAQSSHNLLGLPGVDSVKKILENLLPPTPEPPKFKATQAANAKYDMQGFEASAVTVYDYECLGWDEPEKTIVRRAKISFDNPYTVIAAVVMSGSDKSIPVFIARVEEIVEIAKVE